MEVKKVYGPYLQDRAKGRPRRFVIIHYVDGTKKSTAYARYLWEQTNSPVPEGFDVDHIDNNRLNDVLSNFQLLSKADNRRKASKPAELMQFVCPWCGKEFELFARQYRENQVKAQKRGPYCSKSCAGKASHEPV
jgi:DNA-directed RNA polymerase subunit RPC12/RpoP